MSDAAIETIGGIISEGDLGKFVGVREGAFFEAKGSKAYDFSLAEYRYELAKDVSAFANAQGGWIIIGLTTSQLQAEAVDEVTGLDLIKASDFNAGQFSGIVAEYVRPPVEGLTAEWIADTARPEHGVAAIKVPAQADERKPFLIARVVESGKHLKQIVFGYVRRVGEDAEPHDVEHIRRAMRDGMHPIPQRLSRLEEKLDAALDVRAFNVSVAPEPADDPFPNLGDRIESIVKSE